MDSDEAEDAFSLENPVQVLLRGRGCGGTRKALSVSEETPELVSAVSDALDA